MKTRRNFIATLIAAATLGANRRACAAAQDIASDGAIRELLRIRVDVEKRTVGMAVAVVTPRRTRFITWGRQKLGDDRPVTADTVFEIGSITKVFACLLMADMTRRKQLDFNDPVSAHLPGDFRVPQHEGRPITLADLATHFSGLPRSPMFSSAEEFLRFGVPEFRDWLADARPEPHTDSSGWWYSNAGYWLLGIALAHRGGRPFESLLHSRVIAPLNLGHTKFQPTRDMRSRLADGHDASLVPLPAFQSGAFTAAGGLRSSARDLARFTEGLLPGSRSRWAALNEDLLSVQRPAILAPFAPTAISANQAMGWEVRKVAGGDFLSKDGVTPGQTASVVIDTHRPLAVIVLSNAFPDLRPSGLSGGGIGAADLAQHLIRPEIRLRGEGGTLY